MSKPLEPIPVDLAGKIAIVTGATSGIGKEAAYGLGRLGANVTLCGRSDARLRATVAELVTRGVAPERMTVAIADLSRTTSTRELADQLAARHPRIDILLNNAGCYPAARVITLDGFEESWATNVLAYEILTTRLRSAVEAARGRIVYVGSARAGKLDADDLDWTRRRWNGIRAYSQSKQANRMLAWAWARRLDGTGATINVAHPGGVATNIAHRQRGIWGLLSRLAFLTQRSPARGADTLTWLAASTEVAGKSGGFFADRREIRCRWRRDDDDGEALWRRVQVQLADGARYDECAGAQPPTSR